MSTSTFPLNTFKYPAIKNGTIKQTIEGITTVLTSPIAVTLSAIQSIVVVTSPIGDHAPPAFAATTTMAAYQSRSSLLLISLRNKVTKTIVAVRLSIIAERIKARIPIIHNNLFLLFVRTAPFNISKPRCKSMISTIVIAPIKKISISEVFPK